MSIENLNLLHFQSVAHECGSIPVDDSIDSIHRATWIMNYYLNTTGRINADVVIESVAKNFGRAYFFAIEEIKETLMHRFRNTVRRWSRKILGRPAETRRAQQETLSP